MKLFSALGCGALFGAGLALSGMVQPQKILGFLGLTDPTLAFVMGAALVVHFGAQRLAKRMRKPLLVAAFPAYPFTRIDPRLIAGSLLFGLGWGVVGFCPAPGIISAAAGTREGLLFVPSMLAGMALFHLFEAVRARVVVDETGVEPAVR
jgi:uncharacterized membrane protein YedE/YeeE